MSHRLQVLIPEELDLAVSQAAAHQRVSKGEFARSAIGLAISQPIHDPDPVSRLTALNGPTADINELLAQSDSRYE